MAAVCFNRSKIFSNMSGSGFGASLVLSESQNKSAIISSSNNLSNNHPTHLDLNFIVEAHESDENFNSREFVHVIKCDQAMPSNNAEELNFRKYFDQYPQLQHLRVCSISPGKCTHCDKTFVKRLKGIIASNPNVYDEPLQPYFQDTDEIESMTEALSQSAQVTYHSRSVHPVNRRQDNWFSLRPCHEFQSSRTCRYGEKCRFSHNCLTYSAAGFGSPQPMINQVPSLHASPMVMDFRQSLPPHAKTPFQSPAMPPRQRPRVYFNSENPLARSSIGSFRRMA